MIDATRLSIIVNPFHDRSFDHVVALAREVGVGHLEFPHGVWPHLEPNALRGVLERNELACQVVSLPARLGRIGEAEKHEEVMSLIAGAIETAAATGARYIQCHTVVGRETGADQVIRQLTRQIRPVIDLARRSGVDVLLENNFDSRWEDQSGLNPARRAETMLALADALGNEGFGFCYDPTNFVMTESTPYPDAFRILRPLMRNVHIKDCVPLPGPTDDDAVAPPDNTTTTDSRTGRYRWVRLGEGSLDWPPIIAALGRSDYDGLITLEPVWCRDMTLEGWTADAAETVRGWLDRPVSAD